jgi:molybdate transport system substrate-binding protein
MIRLLMSCLIVLVMGAENTAHSQDKTITVFAAASLKNALDDVDAAFTKQTGPETCPMRVESAARGDL